MTARFVTGISEWMNRQWMNGESRVPNIKQDIYSQTMVGASVLNTLQMECVRAKNKYRLAWSPVIFAARNQGFMSPSLVDRSLRCCSNFGLQQNGNADRWVLIELEGIREEIPMDLKINFLGRKIFNDRDKAPVSLAWYFWTHLRGLWCRDDNSEGRKAKARSFILLLLRLPL